MKKVLCLTLIGLTLSGCMLRTHKADVVQGNIITDEQVHQLHVGMTESEVRAVMGNPVMDNVFTPNREIYIYTYQEGYGTLKKKTVTLTLQSGRVTAIQAAPYR